MACACENDDHVAVQACPESLLLLLLSSSHCGIIHYDPLEYIMLCLLATDGPEDHQHRHHADEMPSMIFMSAQMISNDVQAQALRDSVGTYTVPLHCRC